MTHTKSRKVARQATKAEFIKIALKHHSKIHAHILWKLFSRSKRGRQQNKFVLRILKIIKKNSNNRINRILETNHKILNDKIWSNSKYKRKLSIEEIISTL